MKSCMKCIVAAMGLSVGVGVASGQSLNEDLKLTASDGTAEDELGQSVAIDNGIVVVGSIFDDDHGVDSGSAYLFNASTGMQLFKLTASDGAIDDQFSATVAIGNGIVAVGSIFDDDNGFSSGSVYLFDAATGLQLFKLTASDGASPDHFGYSIAIDNGIVAVGAKFDSDDGPSSGSAYLFDASTGKQLFKLKASDADAGDRFGHSISIDNGIVAVGSVIDADNGINSGSAYLFDASTGMQLIKLTASDGEAGNRFGHSIAIDNGIVAVGAVFDADNGPNSGSAYLFDASTGIELFKLTASDGVGFDWFGSSVAIDNGLVVVGSVHDDDHGTSSGSAYLFDASTGEQLAKLAVSDGSTADFFGSSVAIDNGIVSVGSPLDDDLGDRSGSAYIFDVACSVDLNNDFHLNFYDVSGFLQLFVAGDLAADFNDDGVLNFVDVSLFIADFGQGCALTN